MEATTEPTKTTLSLEFKEDVQEQLPVVLDEKALKRAQRLEDMVANEKLGIRSIKLRLNTYRLLKKQIDALGLRSIGQCTILIANDRVESVLEELDGLAKEMDLDSSASKELRMELRRLKLDCIKVMMASGTDQLKVDRQPSEQPSTCNIQLPFPSGTPIAVAIGRNPSQVEDAPAAK